MAFRHYTKLKEIANKYGCDSAGCTTNGALLDRIYETPVNVNHVRDIKLKAIKPVEGYLYQNSYDFYSKNPDGYLLAFDKVECDVWHDEAWTDWGGDDPCGKRLQFGDFMCGVGVDNYNLKETGEIFLCNVTPTAGEIPFTLEEVQQIKTSLASEEVVLELITGVKFHFVEVIA